VTPQLLGSIFVCELSCSDAPLTTCHSGCTECEDGSANADLRLWFSGRYRWGEATTSSHSAFFIRV